MRDRLLKGPSLRGATNVRFGSRPSPENAATLQDFLSPACFWVPEQLGPQYAWLEHAPFAFWLIEALRPRVLVELGTHGGYSYFVFCQAVQRLNLETRCFAVDTWKGDQHAGYYGEDVYEQVRAHHDHHYSAFSTLIRSSFDEALPHFSEGTIDLLHIDGRHLYQDVKHDFETWRPKLSDQGVVLLHDTNVRERDFGVFKFWEELRLQRPHFEFVHGHGLGVLGIGSNLPDNIAAFFASTDNEQATFEIRAAYSRLGHALSLQVGNQRQAAELARRTAEVETLRNEVKSIKASTSWRLTPFVRSSTAGLSRFTLRLRDAFKRAR